MPQFHPPPPLPHFRSSLGAQVHFISFDFLGHSFRFILMFFNRYRFSILHRPVNHSRTSSTARQEVVAATPTTQTMMVLLDWLLCCKHCDWLLCCKLCETTLDDSAIFVCYVKICAGGSVVFRFKKIFNFCRPTIADRSY
jgi:hypothetical protein